MNPIIKTISYVVAIIFLLTACYFLYDAFVVTESDIFFGNRVDMTGEEYNSFLFDGAIIVFILLLFIGIAIISGIQYYNKKIKI